MEILKNHRIDFDPSNYGFFKKQRTQSKKMSSKVSIFCQFFHETRQLFETSQKPKTRGYLNSKIEKKLVLNKNQGTMEN